MYKLYCIEYISYMYCRDVFRYCHYVAARMFIVNCTVIVRLDLRICHANLIIRIIKTCFFLLLSDPNGSRERKSYISCVHFITFQSVCDNIKVTLHKFNILQSQDCVLLPFTIIISTYLIHNEAFVIGISHLLGCACLIHEFEMVTMHIVLHLSVAK